MAIRLGTVSPLFRVGTETPSRIFLGNDLAWPEFTEATTTFNYTSSGAVQIYNIPTFCSRIDLIAIGGGGGGQGSGCCAVNGFGGQAGTWDAMILIRGVDIPWDLTQLCVVVGFGGSGGTGLGGAIPGLPGGGGSNTSWYAGPTTASTEILRGELGIGGIGGIVGANVAGASSPDFTFNGITYPGATGGRTSGQAGGVPGAAGAGATGGLFIGSSGGKGGNGRAYARAY
ncbi:hypothetical protein 40AC_9 [Mycobacterium phage 40AC]|uniref:Glycine-rich domain-containing protein n=1 Tax=Mycobacterium phage 40AC TaxID=1458717 RepID=W8EAI0_9CAUD|nr:minor tail protein [Mycobacterium phage 40AC]AHJ86373.1 hypothetical protein 40AC_9 [Mycobacterium phage 40AC]